MSLTIEKITELMASDAKRASGLQTPQVGPLRYTEENLVCSRRKCMVTTHYRVQGAPLCSIHALDELNQMLIAQGFRGVSLRLVTKPTPAPEDRIITASTRAYLDVGWSLGRFDCIHGIPLDRTCNGCRSTS